MWHAWYRPDATSLHQGFCCREPCGLIRLIARIWHRRHNNQSAKSQLYFVKRTCFTSFHGGWIEWLRGWQSASRASCSAFIPITTSIATPGHRTRTCRPTWTICSKRLIATVPLKKSPPATRRLRGWHRLGTGLAHSAGGHIGAEADATCVTVTCAVPWLFE